MLNYQRVLSDRCEGQIQNGLTAPDDATNCTCISGCTGFVCETTASAKNPPMDMHTEEQDGVSVPVTHTHTHL